MRRLFCFLAVASILGMAPLVAGTILGNMSGTPLSVNYDIGNHSWGTDEQAEGFTMGGTSQSVAGFSSRLFCASSTCQYLQSATLGLYTNTSSAPGSLIATFNPITSFTPGAASYAFTPTGTMTLNAGTSYWLVLSASMDGDHWAALTVLESSTQPTGSMATYLGTDYSNDSGATWTPMSSFGHGTLVSFFELDGGTSELPPTGTPEPATASLLLAGVVLIGLRRFSSRA